MQSNPEIALDLPLKFLVWKSSDGVILSWNSPTWLAERFEMNPNMEVVKKINNLLEKLSDIIAAV